ncbi:MAG: hypothetical protein K8J31_14795 [Anaerolineae bacterium]|nr:hypothetical protein [Anaerolineae bacterium]
MTTSSHPLARFKKPLLQVLTIALWLATVALGFWAVVTFLEGVDAQILAFTFQKIENQEMGLTTSSGLRRVVNYGTIAIGILVWIGAVVIGGMEYHFKRIGKRSSYRVFAWTIGIELALLAIGTLLRAT